MISLSNTDVAATLLAFQRMGLRTALVVPTETGLGKSIMDATADVRLYLQRTGLHDFESQPQGRLHKKLLPVTLVSREGESETKLSLYRPETKNGDPRLWIYGLSESASAGDLIAIFRDGARLVALNCSQVAAVDFLEGRRTPKISLPESERFEELIRRVRRVASCGYVPTLRAGDTGVGYTLETMLDIAANSSKKPDFRGIEIKSTRAKTAETGQKTLFSQVPDWKRSRLRGSRALLNERGRYSQKKERFQLFHETNASKPNSFGLQLKVSGEDLVQEYVGTDGSRETDVVWALSKLIERLREKHSETLWVVADSVGKGASEEFRYARAQYSWGVNEEAFPLLLESGAISVHYLIKETAGGGAKDQGYLFKTHARNIPLLFAHVIDIDLTA